MRKDYLKISRRQHSAWATEFPIGDPTGGTAYGEFNDPVTAAIGIGGTLLGGAMSADASQSAADTHAGAANNATQAQLGMYNDTVRRQQPFLNAGNTALSTLMGQLPSLNNPMAIMPSINNTNWKQYMSPAYDFQLQQGQQALQNSQAAGDGVLSGAALKGLVDYNQNMANTGFQSAFNNYQTQYQNQFNQYQTQNQNIYNRLAGLAQLGQNAAANTGMTGAGMAGGIANTITGAGNAQAAGQIGSANAITGALERGTGYYMLNNLTGGNLFGGGGGGFGYSGPGSLFGGGGSDFMSNPSAGYPLSFGF